MLLGGTLLVALSTVFSLLVPVAVLLACGTATGLLLRSQQRALTFQQSPSVLTFPERVAFFNLRLFVPLTALSLQTHGISLLLMVPTGLAAASLGPTLRRMTLPSMLLPLMAATFVEWASGGVVRAFLPAAALLAVLVSLSHVRQEAFPEALLAVLDSVAIYLIVGLVGYFVLGLRAPIDLNHSGALPSTIPLFGTRIIFPFSSALTTPPAMAAAYLCAFAILVRVPRHSVDVFRIVGACAAVLVILAANGRAAMIAAVILGLVLYLRPQAAARYALPAALLVLFLPVWWPLASLSAAPLLSTVADNVPALLTRGRADTLVSLQGRALIWSATLDEVRSFDFGRLLLGFGASGQTRWSPSPDYFSVVGRLVVDPISATAHNSLLQQVVDGGFVGAALLVLVAKGAFDAGARVLRRERARAVAASLGLLLSLCLTGSNEATLASSLAQETWWLFLVVLVVLASYEASLDSPVAVRRPKASSRLPVRRSVLLPRDVLPLMMASAVSDREPWHSAPAPASVPRASR